MVRNSVRLLVAAAAVLTLASCFFALTAFPPTLTQVLARADLSSVIPAGAGSQYQLFIVTPTGGEFVMLMRMNGGTDPLVIVMDPNLNLIQTYGLAQMTGWTYDGIGYRPMTIAEGTVEISNLAFTAANLSSVGANPSFNGYPSVTNPGFCSPTAQKNDINFITAGNTFVYDQWTWFHAAHDFTSAPIQISAGGNYNVVAVYNVDDTPAAGEVVLVLSDMGNNMYFVAIPLTAVLSDSVSQPLFSNYPYATLSNVSNSSIGFAGDSLVVYNYNSNSLVRYSVKPPFNQLSSLSLGNNNGKNNGNLQYAYKMTGGYSVVFDQVARKLTKVANWW